MAKLHELSAEFPQTFRKKPFANDPISELMRNFQKKPRVRKSFLPAQFWGRKWLRQFYGRLEEMPSFLRKTSMPIKLLRFRRGSWGGGYLFIFFLGGGKCRFYFYGREDFRGQKNQRKLFCTKFSTTLRVMDVRTENRGRPHQEVRFPAAPVVWRNFLTPGHPGVRVRNVRGKSGPKSLCLCFNFSSLRFSKSSPFSQSNPEP